MKYNIYYAPLDFNVDIHSMEFNAVEEVIGFITSIVYPLKLVNDKVYLLALDDEILVTDNGLLISSIFEHNYMNLYDANEINLHEYGSYEEAYKIALMMKETNHLCYI
jgi:hypothetical protein